MSNFLDPLLFGVRNVVQDLITYPTRNKLRINGAVITDDAENNETVIDIVGGGGGGIPATAAPLDVAPSAAVGTATKYAREDHAHKLSTAGLSAATSTLSADLSFNSRKLQLLGAPTVSTDAARLGDVTSAIVAGQSHPSVMAFDDGYGLTLSGVPVADGVTVPVGRRIGLNGYGSNDGIWIVQSGAWIRPADWANGRALRSDTFLVDQGVVFGGQEMAVIHAYHPADYIVGTDDVDFDILSLKTKTSYGEVTGPDYDTRVEKASGDAMSQTFKILAPKVRSASDENLGYTECIQANVTTASTSPSNILTRSFASSAGSITVSVQVDAINASGVAESHLLRETRSFDGVTGPALIGSSDSNLKPASPTTTVAINWFTTYFTVTVTAPSATATRFAGFIQLSEVPHP